MCDCVCVCVLHPDPTLKVNDPSYLLNDDVDDYHNGVDDDDMKKMMSGFPPAPLQEARSVPEEESARAAPTEARCSEFHFISFYFFSHDGILSASLDALHEMPAMETFLGAVTADWARRHSFSPWKNPVWIFCSI